MKKYSLLHFINRINGPCSVTASTSHLQCDRGVQIPHVSTKLEGIDFIAQLVEHRPFKAGVLGSNPSGVTKIYQIFRGEYPRGKLKHLTLVGSLVFLI